MIHRDFYNRLELMTPWKEKQKNYLLSGTFPGGVSRPVLPPSSLAGACTHTITTLTTPNDRRQWESVDTLPKDN